jgi:hypothetical protein
MVLVVFVFAKMVVVEISGFWSNSGAGVERYMREFIIGRSSISSRMNASQV